MGAREGKGRRLCGLAISQDGREMEGGTRKKENKSIRLPVRCCYMAVPPVQWRILHHCPPTLSFSLSQSFIAQKRGALATWRQFPYTYPKSQLLYALTSSCTLVPNMKRTSYDLCWSSLSALFVSVISFQSQTLPYCFINDQISPLRVLCNLVILSVSVNQPPG